MGRWHFCQLRLYEGWPRADYAREPASAVDRSDGRNRSKCWEQKNWLAVCCPTLGLSLRAKLSVPWRRAR